MASKSTYSRATATPVQLDIDQLRKSKSDGRNGQRIAFKVDGVTYEVPARLPLMFGILLSSGRMWDALRLWLGDEQMESFAASSLTDDEFAELIEGLYGATPGESDPSAS